MSTVTQIFAETLYDGESNSALKDQLVQVENGQIVAVSHVPHPPGDTDLVRAKVLAPGFIDIQINGGGDVLFNDQPTVTAIETMVKAARKGGTAYILPTFTTAPNQDYCHAISAVNAALEANMPGVLGVHLEGPFLSRHKPGIHPVGCIRKPDDADLELLTEGMSQGAHLITLAPEETGTRFIEALAQAGWIVFAGHSHADEVQMRAACSAGLKGATHLFNAMSQITARDPGVVGFTVATSELYAGIIADGYHVSGLNIQMAHRLMGPERLMLVTDAMATLAGKCTEFRIGGKQISLMDGKLVDASGTLAGAHLSMDKAVRQAVFHLDISAGDALKMASGTPATALGLETELGKIKPGYRASFTMLDADFAACGVIVDGQYLPSN